MKTETETFDIAITFAGAQPVKISDLTREQMEQVKDLFRRARGERSWNLLAHRHAPSLPVAAPAVRRGFLTRLMRRFNRWAMGGCVIAALTLGAQEAFAQELKPRAVEPINVSIAEDSDAGESDRAFNSALRVELGKGREYRFTHTKFDARVLTASTPVVEQGRQTGHAAAVAVLRRGASGFSLRLHIVTAPTIDGAAKDAGAWLKKELTK